MDRHRISRSGRTNVALVIILAAAIFLTGGLFKLQVFEYSSLVAQSEYNRIRVVPVIPRRGIVYDRQGRVLIDGQDVRGYPLARLREQVVMVPQDPFLFGDLLRNNLSYDQPGREEPTIWQAAEDADLKDTIARLPDRLETVVGERGVTLSGVQTLADYIEFSI